MQHKLARIRTGARFGATVGAWLSALGIAVTLISGPVSMQRYRVSLPAVVIVYMVGAVFSGALVGVLLPLTRYAVGAIAVGCLVGAFLEVGIRVSRHGLAPWTNRDTFVLVTFALVIGGGGGLLARAMLHDEPRRRLGRD